MAGHRVYSFKVGTRDSQLALWQAQQVSKALRKHGHQVELVKIKSLGDNDLETPLRQFGGRGIFTKSLDDALLAGSIDMAVHSCKDMPTQLPEGITMGAILKRDDPRDAFVARDGLAFLTEADYPAVIATGSTRRRAQWLHRYPGHRLVELRGNVNTRLSKVYGGSWDGGIFAAAGLHRLGLQADIAQYLDWMIPAPAQGAIAVAVKSMDSLAADILSDTMHDAATAEAVQAERFFLNKLEGGCSAPIGAHARLEGGQFVFEGVVLSPDGSERLYSRQLAEGGGFMPLAQAAVEEVLALGAAAILENIERMQSPKS